MPRKQVVLASRNQKKAAEIRGLFASYDIELLSVTDFPNAPEVQETGSTFAENAALKASEVARAIQRWTIADDSGIAVDALGGAPGVISARYAGEHATDADNNAKLFAELADVPDERRGAQFVCHLALADLRGEIRLSVSAACRGRVLREIRGSNGFGYDPLFLIPEYGRTFGELSPEVKSQLSHRARALRQFIPKLAEILNSTASA